LGRLRIKDETALCLVLSPDDRYLIVGTKSGGIFLCDARDSGAYREVFRISGPAERVAWFPAPTGKPDAYLGFAAASQLRRRGANKTGAYIFPLIGNGPARELPLNVEARYSTVNASGDGRHIVLAGGAKEGAIVMDTVSGKTVASLHDPDRSLHQLAAAPSPDGHTAAVSSDTSDLDLWERRRGKTTRQLKGHQGWIVQLAFSPDGRYLFSGAGDDTGRLWDTKTGAQLGQIMLHEDIETSYTPYVSAVTFSRDGRHVSAVSEDGTVVVADVPSYP
jgi:WD40 repeat protein